MRCLDSSGQPLAELPAFARDREAVVGLYRELLLTRAFDAKALMRGVPAHALYQYWGGDERGSAAIAELGDSRAASRPR